MEKQEINDIQERILTSTSVINYLTNRMDNIANGLESILYQQTDKNIFMNEQVKTIRDWLNASDMQLSKIANELSEICDAQDLIDFDEKFIRQQMKFINSKKHNDFSE